jgi:hypothetical protein
MSTTGPVTRTMRPTFSVASATGAWVLSAVAMSLFSSVSSYFTSASAPPTISLICCVISA